MSSITATTKGKDQHLDRLEVWEAGGVKPPTRSGTSFIACLTKFQYTITILLKGKILNIIKLVALTA